MRYRHHIILSSLFLLSVNAYALDASIDGLYWRTHHSTQWATNLSGGTHDVTFNYRPGIRLGFGTSGLLWNSNFYYTNYYTNSNDYASGSITAAFKGARDAATGTPYTSGGINYSINYNMFDWVASRNINLKYIQLKPGIGLTGGWIYQTINADYANTISVSEKLKNEFLGIGPKASLNGLLLIMDKGNLTFNIAANIAAAYLWGDWSVKDTLHYNPPSTTPDVNVRDSNPTNNCYALQAALGINASYRLLSATLAYEVNDYLDQNQFFDNANGSHDKDLIFQGATLSISIAI